MAVNFAYHKSSMVLCNTVTIWYAVIKSGLKGN